MFINMRRARATAPSCDRNNNIAEDNLQQMVRYFTDESAFYVSDQIRLIGLTGTESTSRRRLKEYLLYSRTMPRVFFYGVVFYWSIIVLKYYYCSCFLLTHDCLGERNMLVAEIERDLRRELPQCRYLWMVSIMLSGNYNEAENRICMQFHQYFFIIQRADFLSAFF